MTEPQPTETLPSPEESPPTASDALRDVALHAAELSEYVGAFLRSKKDGVAVSVRRGLKAAALLVLIILCALSGLSIGIIFIFYGMAEGLTQALGGREWLGYLISGFVPLTATFIFLKFSVLASGKSKLKDRWREYETEISQQRARLGHDAAERASEWASR